MFSLFLDGYREGFASIDILSVDENKKNEIKQLDKISFFKHKFEHFRKKNYNNKKQKQKQLKLN